MLINGEKYACEACVRGHRVSNCQHSDRPLQHINKKGRPVSQCQHCRAMRKSRSAHVKCDCGEKTSKCAHLKQLIEGHRETCCCNHGGRCTCAHKKEPQLGTVPESESDQESTNTKSSKGGIRVRRRANTIQLDGGMTFDESGRHRPAHKNRVSQKSGPYQLSRGNSMHSSSSLSSENHFVKSASTSRLNRSSTSRKMKSESASPDMPASPTFSTLENTLPPLDMTVIPPFASKGGFDIFGHGGFSPDTDGPMYSAGLGTASVDWSGYNLGDVKAGEFAPSSYSQAGTQSYSGVYDFSSEAAPTLAGTTSTSEEVSEVEDNFIADDIDFDGFPASHEYLRQGMNAGLGSIDYSSFVKGSAKFLPAPLSIQDDGGPIVGNSFSLVEDDPVFWAQTYNEGVAPLAESPDGLPTNSFWETH